MSDVVIKIRKENLWKYSTFVLAALLIVTLFYSAGNRDSSGTIGNVIQQLPGKQEAVSISEDDDAVLGDNDASVTIIEFSDYECPFCGRHFQQTYPLIKANYIETGKAKLVFRDFPLSFHPNALPAAIAAECVREQGGDEAYWKMHDLTFQKQQELSIVNLKKWAQSFGYDIGSCLDSNKYESEVQKDAADGANAGVSGTPAFFINKKLISGACPYSTFEQAINTEITGKEWSVSNCQVSIA